MPTKIERDCGRGVLAFEYADAPAKEQPCEFECWQSRDGSVRCRCTVSDPNRTLALGALYASAIRLSGCNHRGETISALGLHPAKSFAGEAFLTFDVRKVDISTDSCALARKFEFGLSNLYLNRLRTPGLAGRWSAHGAIIELAASPAYERVERRFRSLGFPGISATATIMFDREMSLPEAVAIANHLCTLLTLAQGTLVCIANGCARGPDGTAIARFYGWPPVRRRASFPLVDEQDFDEFLGTTLGRIQLVDKRWDLRSVGWALVDAKDDTDFLEARGTKAATLLDFICNRYRRIVDEGLLLSRREFDDWKRQVSPCLQAALTTCAPSASDDVRRCILDHLPEFNRPTFRHTLVQLLQYLDLGIPNDAIVAVIRSRNELVHELSFVSSREPNPSTDDLFAEYARLLDLTSRIILRVIGYDGPMLVYGDGPRRRELVREGHR